MNCAAPTGAAHRRYQVAIHDEFVKLVPHPAHQNHPPQQPRPHQRRIPPLAPHHRRRRPRHHPPRRTPSRPSSPPSKPSPGTSATTTPTPPPVPAGRSRHRPLRHAHLPRLLRSHLHHHRVQDRHRDHHLDRQLHRRRRPHQPITGTVSTPPREPDTRPPIPIHTRPQPHRQLNGNGPWARPTAGTSEAIPQPQP